MSTRLSTIAPDLVERITSCSPSECRDVARQMAEYSLRKTRLRDPRLDAAMAALREGDYGETVRRRELNELEGELDELAWNIQDQVERGEAAKKDYLDAFARARAVASLWSALDDDATQAALDATYEALAATDEHEIRKVLSRSDLGDSGMDRA